MEQPPSRSPSAPERASPPAQPPARVAPARPAPTQSAAPTSARRGTESSGARGPVRLLAATTAIFFITTVIFGLMALRPQSAPINTATTRAAAQVEMDRTVEALAERFATNLSTFDHNSLDRDIDRILADTTENFRSQFHTALNGDINVFRDRIRDSRGQSTGEVKGASVTSREDEAATVLVVVEQTARRGDEESRTDFRLLELAIVNTDAGWKVDNVANPARPAR